MSFSFFKPSRPKTPQDVAKAIRDSLAALDTKTVVEVKSLEKALEEVEKNFATMRCMILGDGEVEPNAEQVSQLAEEICKEDVISLLIHKLSILGWEARKDLVHCWSILLKQKVGTTYCCVQYIEEHFELLDFLVVCYDNKEIALNCGNMLRECIKFPTLAKYILESTSFELFFKFVELPNFDVASDAFSTFKDLLTKHGNLVSEYLTAHYDEFFELYEKLLTSSNYVTRRQSLKLLSEFLLESPNSHIMKRYILEVRYLKVMMTLLKDSSKNIQISAFHIFKDLDLFSDYEWKSPEDCNHYKKTLEDNRIFKFLIGLNVEFDEVRGRIIGRQPLPSLGEVFSEVRREESRRFVMLGKKIPGHNVENSALASTTAEAHAGRFNPRKTEEKPRVWCDYCNKPRHTRETCWKLHGKPENWKGKHEGRFNSSPAAHEAAAVPFSKEQVDHILKLLKSNSGLSGTPSASLAQTGEELGENDWQC